MKQYLEKLTALLAPILEKLRGSLHLHGALFSFAKKTLFIVTAALFGLWLALNFTLPVGVVMSMVNKPLFERDYGLEVESLGYFPLKTFSLEDGTFTQKGENVLTFSELSYSPSLWGILTGKGSGNLFIEDISGKDNYIDASFSLGEFPCYDVTLEDIPLDFLTRLSGTSDASLRGDIDGHIDFCVLKATLPVKKSKRKRRSTSTARNIEGEFSLALHDIVFKGKVQTPMGKLDVGRILFGDIVFNGVMEKKLLKINTFTIDGIFAITVTGDIRLNLKNSSLSRLNLVVSMEIKDEKAVKKNTSLSTVLSFLAQYQDRKNKQQYHFDLKGTLSSPSVQKSRKINRTKKTRRNPSKRRK
ncbi:type II secretion system protein GspN [bacterium]|nr:type II secretion system protein GspN [bacterium]